MTHAAPIFPSVEESDNALTIAFSPSIATASVQPVDIVVDLHTDAWGNTTTIGIEILAFKFQIGPHALDLIAEAMPGPPALPNYTYHTPDHFYLELIHNRSTDQRPCSASAYVDKSGRVVGLSVPRET
jgi:hypothetical protein